MAQDRKLFVQIVDEALKAINKTDADSDVRSTLVSYLEHRADDLTDSKEQIKLVAGLNFEQIAAVANDIAKYGEEYE